MKIKFKRFFHFKPDLLGIGFLLVVGLVSSLSLLNSGYIPTHDGEYHIIRFWQFYKMLSLENWFPRWAPDLNNGYGIPLFNYVYPLPNYISAIFHFIGFSLTDSLKMVLFSGFILSGFSFYVLLRFFFKPLPAVVGSIFYLLAPYHLVDVYIRGSVGEVWALAIAPLVLWSGLSKKYLIFSFLLALLIFSHNILALMFGIFIVLFLVFYNLSLRAAPKAWRGNLFSWIEIASSFRRTSGLLAMTLAGLGLSAIFWLPAIVEEKYVVGLKQVSFSDHFPQIWQLIFPSWGTGFSGTGDFGNQMSFQIGIPHLLVILLVVFIILKNYLLSFRALKNPVVGFFSVNESRNLTQNNLNNYVKLLLLILALTIFLILEFSLPLWKLIPRLSFFQYPWRFLSLVIFITSFLSAWVAHLTNKKWLAILLLILALLFYYPYTKPVVYQERQDSYYLNNPTWTLGTDSPGNSFNTIWFTSNNVLGVKPTNRTVNTAYFPGWQVYVDQTLQKIYPNREGLISFSLAKGQHVIETKFEDTAIRTWAKYISLLSVFLFLCLVILRLDRRIHLNI